MIGRGRVIHGPTAWTSWTEWTLWTRWTGGWESQEDLVNFTAPLS